MSFPVNRSNNTPPLQPINKELKAPQTPTHSAPLKTLGLVALGVAFLAFTRGVVTAQASPSFTPPNALMLNQTTDYSPAFTIAVIPDYCPAPLIDFNNISIKLPALAQPQSSLHNHQATVLKDAHCDKLKENLSDAKRSYDNLLHDNIGFGLQGLVVLEDLKILKQKIVDGDENFQTEFTISDVVLYSKNDAEINAAIDIIDIMLEQGRGVETATSIAKQLWLNSIDNEQGTHAAHKIYKSLQKNGHGCEDLISTCREVVSQGLGPDISGKAKNRVFDMLKIPLDGSKHDQQALITLGTDWLSSDSKATSAISSSISGLLRRLYSSCIILSTLSTSVISDFSAQLRMTNIKPF